MAESGELAVVILAAGGGTRMRSRTPKVLHPVCGRPILLHAVQTAVDLGAKRVVAVLAPGTDDVREALRGVEVVEQPEPLGTAHAALQARERLAGHPGPVLVMYGDHPLYRPETFARLLETYRADAADLALLTGTATGQSDFGRVVRGPDGRVERIVEYADAGPDVRALTEVNLGVYVAEAARLFAQLERIDNRNPKGEYYLTGLVELCLDGGGRVSTASLEDPSESIGVNSRADLARAEAAMRRRIAERWMLAGVTFEDPEHTYVDAAAEIGPDTVLSPGAALRGATRVGAGCRIDAGAVIEDSVLGDEVWIKPHCHLERSRTGDRCVVGPSAHFRPDVTLGDDVRVGNFVEVKNSTLGRGTKADHLSYVGDADVGERVTIGCGAITVNYDGARKSRTSIGDGAFIGCNANLIAPVTVEPGGYVAAGSTITRDVPAGALGVARQRQRNVEGWRAHRFGRGEDE